MSTPAGNFNHRVTLQSSTITTNGAGEKATTWSSIGPIFASVKPVSARERILNGADIDQTGDFTIRIRQSSLTSGIDSSWRVLFGSRVFQIVSIVDPDELGEEFHLVCTETK